MARRHAAWAALTLSLCACAKPGANGPLRSPSLDYQEPATRTADGDTVGADHAAPSDTLGEGPTNAAAAPGWKVDKSGAAYDPKRRVGGSTDLPAPPPATPSQK